MTLPGTSATAFIERLECPNCHEEVGKHHAPDCVVSAQPIEWMGRPCSFVIHDIAVSVRYVREEQAW